MPGYPFLFERPRCGSRRHVRRTSKANRAVGVPYSDEMIENARRSVTCAQADPDSDEVEDAFLERYPKAQVRDFDGNPRKLISKWTR